MTRQVTAQVVIDLPRAAVWDKLRDLSLAHNYVPGIVKTAIIGELRALSIQIREESFLPGAP